jgi:hypothetical protein
VRKRSAKPRIAVADSDLLAALARRCAIGFAPCENQGRIPRVKYRHSSLFERTSRTVLDGVRTWQQLLERLRDVRLQGRELIQVVLVGSDGDVPALLRSANAPPGLKCLDSTEGLALFEYRRKYGPGNRDSISGTFVITRAFRETMYALLFVAEPRFWRHGISPLVDSLYPRATCPFLTQSEIHKLLRELQSRVAPQRVRVLEFSSKKRLGAASRKKFQSVREWTDMELDPAFQEARERNDWFRSVSFDIVGERDGRVLSSGTQAKLSKYAYFACNGRFDLFEEVLIREVIRIGADRLKFFSNRDRLSTAGHVPAPLQIQYATDVFKSRDQSRRLIAAMQKFKHGTCTVLHGNPYVHMTVVDNRDFSSADVWVLSQDQILLVPQIRASAVALKRIVSHIFENFREGKLSEYKNVPA